MTKSFREWAKSLKMPHTLVIVGGLVALVLVLSWVIPSGEYTRIPKQLPDGSVLKVAVKDSYQVIPKFYLGLQHLLLAPIHVDTIALQCTAETCGPGQACAQPNEFCSPRCATPPGGTCFDPSTMQCTQQPCSPSQPCAQANQTCVPECPPPPPKGRCFDTTSKQCTDQPCAPGARCGAPNLLCTLQCPPPFPTPTPQCSSVPCGGQCVIAPPCPAGGPCPEIASRLGQCTLDATGACQCVPPSPGPTGTPQPTPTPQCNSVPCGGPCIVSPCPPGALCPVRPGQCATDATGLCQCVPVIPTPPATPTPQCAGTCAGPCTIISPPFPCPPDKVCNGPVVPVLSGQCEASAAGGCECIPIVPTPAATPTPQCTGGTCGGPCVIVPACPPGVACPNFAIRGECRDDASGTCQCMPNLAPTPSPVPQCTTDAECDDGDGCTVDHCVKGVCEHACICLNAAGAPACCPGPAALCARPCGADASGTCGGTCPPGATCASLPAAPAPCACVSDVGGPCGGNILAPPPVCAPGLVCQQSNPDVTGVCVVPKCIPLFASGCSQTSDCCTPCGKAPCGVCIQGTCVGAP